jgi:membrane peptidoglycan carboxypeptidase
MLAGLVQNPDANNPVRNPSAALDRRDVVLNRMVELKLISIDQGGKQAKKVGFDGKRRSRRPAMAALAPATPSSAITCGVTLLRDAEPGKTTEERENLINRGGLIIQTAI